MRLRTLIAGVCLGLAFTTAQAADLRFASPYQPSGQVLAEVESAPVWAEVYPVGPKEVPLAIARALKNDAPADRLVAVVMKASLHFGVGRTSERLPETSSRLTRDGIEIDYDERCGVSPQAGDRLQTTYARSNSALSAELDMRVVRRFAFGPDSDEPLDLSKPGACEQETHSRIFLSGTLRLKRQGVLQQEIPVLVQSISEPR